MNINEIIEEYVADYEMRGDEGDYQPTENERFLIKDAIYGLIDEDNFQRALIGPEAADTLKEVKKAMLKFPTWPTDPLHAFAVVGEEFGECQKEILQLTYEPHKSTLESARKEAVQMAAMALRFLMSFDRYEFAPGVQHQQIESVNMPVLYPEGTTMNCASSDLPAS